VLHEQGLDELVCRKLGSTRRRPTSARWEKLVDALEHPSTRSTIALVGKYVELQDAYKSLCTRR
jgi:CTP synthase